MLQAFAKSASANFNLTDRISKSEYYEVLRNTQFCPSPMGNVMLETWRTYESIECGCIPLVERRSRLDYYRELFGNHPIPTFIDWEEARRFTERIRRSAVDLNALQSEVFSWWQKEKLSLQQKVHDFVGAGLAGTYGAGMREFHFYSRPWRNVWQYNELLKHHSAPAVWRRVLNKLQRTLLGY